MDVSLTTYPEATTSNTEATTQHNDQADAKPLRSSARVKAAKDKFKGKSIDRDSVLSNQPQASTSSAQTSSQASSSTRSKRSASGRETAREQLEDTFRSTRRSRRSSLTRTQSISEPSKDNKGKKRVSPEPSFDESASAGPSTKRPRTSYSLRSQTIPVEMTKKSKSAVSKGKMAEKTKAMAVASSSRVADVDVDMLDSECKPDVPPDSASIVDEDMEKEDDVSETGEEGGDGDDKDEDDDEKDQDSGDDDEEESNALDGAAPAAPSLPHGMDEVSAMAIFGDYRQFGSYMISLSQRLKSMLNNIKASADPTTRLLTLQELSELLSISTEDTLAGSFPVEAYVKELVKILGGKGASEDEDEDGDDEPPQDEDAALAAVLAMSTGGAYAGDENLEAQVLACRCLANLMEALPGVAHTVVYHGAIPVLCSKLIEISYIDLAEQTLSTMEKISEEFPSAIVREGGLSALLNYLDFFSIAVQRTALQAASNCCRNVSSDHFQMIKDVWPIIRNCLTYSDQRLVEFACLSVIRVIDSYHRGSVEHLEALVDTDLIKATNMLLLPAGGSPLIASNTYTLLLRALATAAKTSPKITIALLEADFVDTIYQILTGVLPPTPSHGNEEQGDASTGQGLGGGLADMTVMENLAHRPKDQIEEALSLVSELMPPLPKDGVFDHKGYTEKALNKMVKVKAKADRAAARQAAHAAQASPGTSADVAHVDETAHSDPVTDSTVAEGTSTETAMAEMPQQTDEPLTPAPPDRTELLRSKPVVVGRFIHLLVPILIDVYAASVITPVRVKTLTGLLKAISFLEADGLQKVLSFVPVASFASSILSSRDHTLLVLGALQLVDLLLLKVPVLYAPAFRREGVFHEIEALAARTTTSSKAKEKTEKETSEAPSEASSTPSVPPIPAYKRLSSQMVDADDAVTMRARVVRFKYLAKDEVVDSDGTYDTLRRFVDQLAKVDASEQELEEALSQIAHLFSTPHTSVSSFELLQSGLVDGLLQFTTDVDRIVSLARRKELLLDALVGRKTKDLTSTQTPFTTFVKKLQESLTRMEGFEVVTVAQSSDDSKRSSPSLLARQLRLRLVAGDDSGIPRNLNNIVVSIHAIATFQALHDYLRPRVTGVLGSGSSRASSLLSALAGFGALAAAAAASGSSDTSKAAPAESSSSASASGSTITRRRSQRLSAKSSGSKEEDIDPSAAVPPAEGSAAVPPPEPVASGSEMPPPDAAPSDTLVDSELAADFTDDEIEAEVFDDDEAEGDVSISDKTVTLSVAEDGSKVEAKTPDGTRVATPAAGVKEGPSSPSRGPTTRASYANALKAKPTDWHLEFSMDDNTLPLDLTIYGAIHQHEMRKKTGTALNMIWQGVYTIKFKKVAGPAPVVESRPEGSESTRSRPTSPSLSSLPEDAPHAKILRLLRVLHQINVSEGERSAFSGDRRVLPESSFVNNKLSAKLTRQLEEPMIVASSCLPDWALDLPQHFPFLFPFATRYNFLQSTSFGYARLILKWQSQQARTTENSRRDDGIGFLGRLQRQKVRISRKHILESAVKVFELYGSSSSILEVEYFEEVGTGLGPTLEFYSLVSREFARKDLKIWRDSHHAEDGIYVNHSRGLFPAPISPEDLAKDDGQKRTHIFKVIGQFIAKALLDSRILDISFNKVFLKLILGEEVAPTIATLKLVDVDLANSLLKIQSMASGTTTTTDKFTKTTSVVSDTIRLEDLALDFTIPGHDIELRPGGRDITVTEENVDDYIHEVIDAIIGKGASLQVKAFREGFSKVFPITELQAFSSDELVMLFGNGDEDWSSETLGEALKADHGFNPESRAIRDLIEIMSEYDVSTRRSYLQFITGSPKLPIGGFRGLNPPFTVVRKPHEHPLSSDDYLPSVMTCVNYLKLPEYSSKAVMKNKIRVAMLEGVGSFHLS